MSLRRRFLLFVSTFGVAAALANPLHPWAQTKGTPSTTKTLRPANARPLIQEAVNATNRGSYLIDFSALNTFDNPTFVDYSVGDYEPGSPGWQRQQLQRGRFIEAAPTSVTVPKLSGTFRNPNDPQLLVQLSMNPNDPPLISGTFEKPGLGASCVGRLRGSWIVATWSKLGAGVSLFFDVSPGSGCLRMEEPIQYSVASIGEMTTLVRRDSGATYVRGPSTGEITLRQYSYLYTDTFDKFVQSPGKLQAGLIEVDSVEQLFLSPLGETVAEGRFKWHVKFNRVAQALTGKAMRDGIGRVQFRKQPDGDWALTEYRLD